MKQTNQKTFFPDLNFLLTQTKNGYHTQRQKTKKEKIFTNIFGMYNKNIVYVDTYQYLT